MKKWKELYCGNSLSQFLEIKKKLNDHKIAHKSKLKKHESQPPFRGFARNALGRVGEYAEHSTIYYIYVNYDDFENATNILTNAAT